MPTYSAEKIIAIFAQVARPIILSFFPPNSCIASSRITIEVLRRFGIQAEAVATKFVVKVPSKNLAYVSGLDQEERERARKTAASFQDRGGRPDSMDIHVIVVAAGRFVIDASFDQAADALGVDFGQGMFVIPLPPDCRWAADRCLDMDLGCFLDDGTVVDFRYITTESEAFKQAPAWETDHLQTPIRLICHRIANDLARHSAAVN